MLRAVLISILVPALPGCATAPAPQGPAIVRLAPEELARLAPKPEAQLPLAELVRLAQAGATAQELIARIKQTNSRYDLSASQAIDLNAQGVNKEVLDYIQSAQEQRLRDRNAEEINQRERLHAEALRREQEQRPRYYNYGYDPWLRGYPGYGWNYGYPFQPFGGFYWRR